MSFYLFENHHTTFVFDLLKEGYTLKQGSSVIMLRDGKVKLLSNENNADCKSSKSISLNDIFIFHPLTVQRGSYEGEKVWITGITSKMVRIELDSGETARISKTSLIVQNWSTPSLRRSPRRHKTISPPITSLETNQLTLIEEVDEDKFVCFEETVQVKDLSTPTTKRVRFTASVVSEIRLFEALGNLTSLFK